MSQHAPDRYAVVGNPIAHSKSPTIHALFAQATGQALVYEALLAPLGRFAQTVSQFRDQGGRGLNVTVPFKQEAWDWVDELTPRAKLAGAVNTIAFQFDGSSLGDNTDGVGLVRDLRANLRMTLTHRRLLLLGAGGAARGVLGPLLDQRPHSITIANRTVPRAQALAADFATLGPVTACAFHELGESPYDLVLNATSAGLQAEVPPLPPTVVGPQACCYDMVYAAQPTAFVCWAKQQGAQLVVDGLGMLVEQAAESFRLWRGVLPETAPVIEALRKAR